MKIKDNSPVPAIVMGRKLLSFISLYLPLSPFIFLYLPLSSFIFLYLPLSSFISIKLSHHLHCARRTMSLAFDLYLHGDALTQFGHMADDPHMPS